MTNELDSIEELFECECCRTEIATESMEDANGVNRLVCVDCFIYLNKGANKMGLTNDEYFDMQKRDLAEIESHEKELNYELELLGVDEIYDFELE